MKIEIDLLIILRVAVSLIIIFALMAIASKFLEKHKVVGLVISVIIFLFAALGLFQALGLMMKGE